MPRRGLMSGRIYHRCGKCRRYTPNVGACATCQWKERTARKPKPLPAAMALCSAGCGTGVEFDGCICLSCAAQDAAFVQACGRGDVA